MKKLYLLILILNLLISPNAVFADRIWSSGIEMQSITDGMEFSTNYGGVIDTSFKHSGAASMRFSGSMGADTAIGFDQGTFANQTHSFFRWYVYVDDLPITADNSVYLALYSGATAVINLDLVNIAGVYTLTPYYNNFGANLTPFVFLPDQWNYIEVEYDSTPANGSEVFRVYLNGSVAAQATNLNFTTKSINTMSQGIYNGSAGTVTTNVAYIDDMAINDTSGSGQTSFPGEGKIVLLCANAAGDNAPDQGTSPDNVDECTPPDDSTTEVDLDNDNSTIDVGIASPTGAGMQTYDVVKFVSAWTRISEESSATQLYALRIKSAAGATTIESSETDAGNATYRTNTVGTTAYRKWLVAHTDPTTTAAWTVTGTNSVDNAQIGVRNGSANDLEISSIWALVEYTDGTPPAPGGAVIYEDFWD